MYVYRHIRLDKNEPFYIGVGKKEDNVNFTSIRSEYRRAYDKRQTRRNPLWGRIAAKGDYLVEILFDDLSPQAAAVKEKEFVALYGRINTKSGTLANLTDGGEGQSGYVMPLEVREKIRVKAMGNKNGLGNIVSVESRKRASEQLKNNKIALGHKHSPEHREKNRQAHLGVKFSEETKMKLKAICAARRASGYIRPAISQETREKLSKASKGRVLSEEAKAKMRGKRGKQRNRKGFYQYQFQRRVFNLKQAV